VTVDVKDGRVESMDGDGDGKWKKVEDVTEV
jgi:hypothetical protein